MTDHLNESHVVKQPATTKVDAETQETAKDASDRDLTCNEDTAGVEEGSLSVMGTPALLSNLGLASTAVLETTSAGITRSDLPDPSVLTSQVRSVAKSLPIVATSAQDLELYSLASTAASGGVQVYECKEKVMCAHLLLHA